jgi:serine/threonine-protein phosphatase 2A activator
MWQELPLLRDISLSEVLSLSELPKAQIKTDDDLEHWKSMQSYRDYILFLRRLNESVEGTSLPWIPEHRSQV